MRLRLKAAIVFFGLLVTCGILSTPIQAANDGASTGPSPAQVEFQKEQMAASKQAPKFSADTKAPDVKTTPGLKRPPRILDAFSVLEMPQMYTLVPKGAIVFHGKRSAVQVTAAFPPKKKYVSTEEFLKSYPNDVVLVRCVSTHPGIVDMSDSFDRDDVKIVIAVDERGVPATTVTLK